MTSSIDRSNPNENSNVWSEWGGEMSLDWTLKKKILTLEYMCDDCWFFWDMCHLFSFIYENVSHTTHAICQPPSVDQFLGWTKWNWKKMKLVRKILPFFFVSSSNVKCFYHHLKREKTWVEGFSYLMSSLPNNPPSPVYNSRREKKILRESKGRDGGGIYPLLIGWLIVSLSLWHFAGGGGEEREKTILFIAAEQDRLFSTWCRRKTEVMFYWCNEAGGSSVRWLPPTPIGNLHKIYLLYFSPVACSVVTLNIFFFF